MDKQRNLQEQNAYNDIAEAVSPVMHALGNLVNNMALEASTLQIKAPPEFTPGFQSIRETARAVGDMLQHFADFRYSKYPPCYGVDVNEIIGQILAEMGLHDVNVESRLTEKLPPVAGSVIQIRNLVRLVVANALRVSMSQPPKITIYTQLAEEGVCFSVGDNGPPFPKEANLADRFEPLGPAREGESSFELAACKGIVRRLGGEITATNHKKRGMTTTVTLVPF